MLKHTTPRATPTAYKLREMSHVPGPGLLVEKFGSCVVVRMTNKSNVLTLLFIEGLHSALDTVER